MVTTVDITTVILILMVTITTGCPQVSGTMLILTILIMGFTMLMKNGVMASTKTSMVKLHVN